MARAIAARSAEACARGVPSFCGHVREPTPVLLLKMNAVNYIWELVIAHTVTLTDHNSVGGGIGASGERF